MKKKKNSGSFMCDNKAKRIREIKISSSDSFTAVRVFFSSPFFSSANELLNSVGSVGAFFSPSSCLAVQLFARVLP